MEIFVDKTILTLIKFSLICFFQHISIKIQVAVKRINEFCDNLVDGAKTEDYPRLKVKLLVNFC